VPLAQRAPAAADLDLVRLTELLMEYGHHLLRIRASAAPNAPGGFGLIGVRAVIRLKLVGPMAMGELAAALAVSPARVTQVVDALERAGHVERRRSASDRRVWQIRLRPGRDRCLDADFCRPMQALRDAWAAVPEEARPAVLAFVEQLVCDTRAPEGETARAEGE